MLKPLGNFSLFVLRFFIQLIKSALNERNIFQLAFNFFRNFSLITIWLIMFKNAGIVPNDIRPKIHVSLIYNLDLKMFNHNWFIYWVLISVTFTIIWSVLIRKFSNYHNSPLRDLYHSDEESLGIELTDTNILNYQDNNNDTNNNESINTKKPNDLENNHTDYSKFDFDDDCSSNKSENESAYSSDGDVDTPASSTISLELSPQMTSTIIPIDLKAITRTHSLYLTPILFFLIWPILNLDQYLAQGLTTYKDLTAWFFYVLGHITFPILTAVWLYVFHTQGALKCFALALGFQNIMGVITHMLFPNAPPWFIHMYGTEDSLANYDLPGYAAGLTRVDTALGTHLHSNGFHKSPIVFGAFPSLHSAMALQVCLFVYYYGVSKILRLCGILFVVIQWWATIYLDHHFRIDLIGGAVYALCSFCLIYPMILSKESHFINARFNGDFSKGSTYGMRVFKNNSKIQKFFDPYR